MKSSQEISALLFKPLNKNWGFIFFTFRFRMFPAVCRFQSALTPGKKSSFLGGRKDG